MPIEHINRKLKIFKILSATYRNHQKRFNLRANLIAGIVNQMIWFGKGFGLYLIYIVKMFFYFIFYFQNRFFNIFYFYVKLIFLKSSSF